MAATLEVKYFNTFWLKKIKAVTDVQTTTVVDNIQVSVTAAATTSITLSANTNLFKIGAGQVITNNTTAFTGTVTVVSIVGQTLTISSAQDVTLNDLLIFTGRADVLKTPLDYTSASNTDDWYIEEARIRGGYNNTTVDFGAKAYLVEDNPNNQNRFNSLIYSGIFNSRTGVNDTNQFSIAESITKSTDPANRSIQKLYAEDTNLIIFQENKVSRALIDKDAIYSAEGSAAITSTPMVIGQIIAYAGEYGISKDPFSFAVYGYRKYFTDRNRNSVLRLSKDGITEISSYGMNDYFRDELSNNMVTKVIGGWDIHNKNYVLHIALENNTGKTLSFDESVLGWTSFLSFKPTFMTSLGSNFFSYYRESIYQHNFGSYNTFYGGTSDSNVTLVLNSNPSLVKNFKTINYEGTSGWKVQSISASSGDTAYPIGAYTAMQSLSALEGDIFSNNFKKKENKFFANLLNNSTVNQGEVIFGGDASGIKGFFATIKLNVPGGGAQKELFAVSSDTVESSY